MDIRSGNVRELRNILERAAICVITPDDLAISFLRPAPVAAQAQPLATATV
jgi:transcriptional regulator with PAS, ATPase and Fis domain